MADKPEPRTGVHQMASAELPESCSSSLQLSHPTLDECVTISTDTYESWKDSLTLPAYLRESVFLATVPLAKNGGMTEWILVDKAQSPNHRHILTSCESYKKRSLQSDQNGNVKEGIMHGIASVFCAPKYRRRGYAARHMMEMAKALRGWQVETGSTALGSVLYSDIGKEYYASFGWKPNHTNFHFEFLPSDGGWPDSASRIGTEDIEDLCRRDEIMIREAMSAPEPLIKTRVVILPDANHMLWHLGKEEFTSKFIFGKISGTKGAIAGKPGKQVWAIWTHRYYDHPDAESPDNVLYILRLVVENDKSANKAFSCVKSEDVAAATDPEIQESLNSVLQAARHQAKEWRLDRVKVWEPSVLAQRLIEKSSLSPKKVDRENESIASCLWYSDDESNGLAEQPVLINNEHYAWC